MCRWMAEKYDGLRACWNPKSKVVYLCDLTFFAFPLFFSFFLLLLLSSFFLASPLFDARFHDGNRYTRRGGTIGVPTSFMRTLPGAFLDGEIWYVT